MTITQLLPIFCQFLQDFRRAIGQVAHSIIDRHRLCIHDENSQAQPRECGAAPGYCLCNWKGLPKTLHRGTELE